MALGAETITDVRPFRALHFDPARVDLATVVTPPYDVIDPAQRAQLAERSPYNVVRLILPDPGEEAAAGVLFGSWLDQGVVVREPDPCLYWLEQDYVGPDGVARTRRGVIAALRLDPYGAGGVRPHERTMAGPKVGRLALLRALRANVSPIFAMYDDPERRVSGAIEPSLDGKQPVLEVTTDDGTTHRLWRVCNEEVAATVTTALAERHVIIADGHHRYETALEYRSERRAEEGDAGGDRAYDFAPVYLANSQDPGLELFPTHRVVKRVDPALQRGLEERAGRATGRSRPSRATPTRCTTTLAGRSHERRAFGLWRGGGQPGLLLTLRDEAVLADALPGASPATRHLDVAAVGALVLDRLLGIDAAAVSTTDRIALPAARRRRRQPPSPPSPTATAVALLLRAPTIEEVEAVAEAGETMPQKSTYFFPKILDGMVFHALDGCV